MSHVHHFVLKNSNNNYYNNYCCHDIETQLKQRRTIYTHRFDKNILNLRHVHVKFNSIFKVNKLFKWNIQNDCSSKMANVLKQQEKQEVGYFHIFNRK